jgi:hypothetical protein
MSDNKLVSVDVVTIEAAPVSAPATPLVPETEAPAEETLRVHASELIPAGFKLVVADPILHVRNLTLWSNQMGVNLAEGKKARIISEPGKIKAALNILCDWRTKADFLAVSDQDGLFQLKTSFDELASRVGDTENIGTVNALYTGKFAGNIVGFENAKAAAIEGATNELEIASAKTCWFRMGFVGGQLKISKRLVNLPAEKTEGDEVTHMRRQIMRSAAVRDLLDSEANGTPILFKWSYQFGFVAAWYIGQFLKTVKEAYADARSHTISAQVYKQEARFRASLNEQGQAPAKTVVTATNGVRTAAEVAPAKAEGTLVLNHDGGMIDLAANIGKHLTRWIGQIPFAGPDLFIAEGNLTDLVEYLNRRRMSVDIH